jgi:UDPglucose 6-dehydrogenase
MNVDVVTDALKDSTFRITGPKYMKAGMGDAGPCHPRDNIALRFLAHRLDLRYDLFESIMVARDTQARNLASTLAQLSEAHALPIFIHGEAYKPGVEYLEGSYSTLVASYLHNYSVTMIDPLTRPAEVPESVRGVILMAHNAKVTYDYTGIPQVNAQYCRFEEGSVVVDPWRVYPQTSGLKVVHYGNTRSRQ